MHFYRIVLIEIILWSIIGINMLLVAQVLSRGPEIIQLDVDKEGVIHEELEDSVMEDVPRTDPQHSEENVSAMAVVDEKKTNQPTLAERLSKWSQGMIKIRLVEDSQSTAVRRTMSCPLGGSDGC